MFTDFVEKNRKNESSQNAEQGFSLIELLIVVLIIGIVSVIAVPNLLQARRAANEASALSSISLLFRSEIAFMNSSGVGEFTSIANLRSNGYLDEVLGGATHTKSGFRFEVDLFPSTPLIKARINIRARPVVHSITNPISGTGGRDFGMSEVGGIYKTENNTPVTFDDSTRLPTGTAVPIDGS